VLKSTPGPTALELPIALTAAQNVWYETALLWEDRQTEVRNRVRAGYGGPGWGGMGADFPVKGYKAPPPPPPVWAATWIKVLGSWTDRTAHGDIIGDRGRRFDIDLGYKQDTYGIIGGLDAGKEGWFSPYDAAVVGIMGGYVDSKVNFDQRGTSFRFTGGTIGTWASYMANGWFIDGTGKADFLKLSFNTPGVPVHLPEVDVRNLGFIGNVGYRWDWGRWFTEPIGTLTYVRTHIDDITASGLPLTTIAWNTGDSLRGAIGARTGVAFMGWYGKRVEASITTRLWDEWRGNNGIVLQPVNLEFTDNFTKPFWEAKGTIDVLSLTAGWSGFVNAGVKWNEEFHTVNAKAGVSYKWGGG
jgi:hypothetical protein